MLRAFWTVLATGFALAVIALSMAMNFAFGSALGTTPAKARILGALSVACDGLKALLPLFIAWQWADGRRLAAAAGALLFLLLLGFGMASAIGFAAENRAAFTGQRDTRNASLAETLADLKAAEARAAALPAHRVPPVVAAEIAALKKDRIFDATGGCADASLPASRRFCKQLALLQGELALGAEAAAIETRIEDLKLAARQARAGGAGPESDPQARAIAAFTGLDTGLVRSGIIWLLAIAVEAISAFGLFAISRRGRAHPQLHHHGGPAADPAHALAPASSWRLLRNG